MQHEEQLVQRAMQGEREAFSQLLQLYQRSIYNLALRMVGDREDACDLTQEIFLKAWRSLAFFRGEASFSTWLYRLASNICIDFLRKEKRRKSVSLVFLDDEESYVTEIPSDEPLPEEQVISREELRQLSAAMNELEVEYRQILTLRLIDNLPYEQIAEILDLELGTVKSRLWRARTKLRKKLTGNKTKPMSSIHTGKENA